MVETHPQNRRLGYARVSTYGQTLDAQLEQLRAEGCSRIYREKVTGAHNDRRELLKMLKGLAPGDVVTVTRPRRANGSRRKRDGASEQGRAEFDPCRSYTGRSFSYSG